MYSGKQTQGGKVIYSDVVIEMILVLSYVYSLPLRQTEGFVSRLLALNGQRLSVPDYTTVCRRKNILDVSKKLRKWNGKENIVFSIDGSGLKCCGEKEWMQIKHRVTRRGKFIKIHAGINVTTREILYNKSTSSRVSDVSVLSDAVEKVGNQCNRFLADGGYDSKYSYTMMSSGVEVVIPPRKNAVKDSETHQRNQAIDYISEHSKSRWKRDVGYHDRAIIENTLADGKPYLEKT
jgi:IS5 family transposase